MVSVTLNAQLPSVLAGMMEEAEILDDDGNVVGYFTPRERANMKRHEQARKLFDAAEGKRRAETEGEGRPLEEILRRLQGAEAPG
jgi:hypothetical protein